MKSLTYLFCLLGLSFSLNAAESFDPEKAKKGQKLFTSTAICFTCHGKDGTVPTIPTARNFAKDPFKQGSSIKEIMNTIKNGIPGTAMLAQATVKTDEDREALAHFVVSVINRNKTKSAPKPTAAAPVKKEAPKVAPKPVPVKETQVAAPAAPKAPAKTTSSTGGSGKFDLEKAKKGRELFTSTALCYTCHGKEGKVPTIPNARNFEKDPFKQGTSISDIMNTLKNGIPGTGMLAQAAVKSDEERELLAHFVVSVINKHDYNEGSSAEGPSAHVEAPVFKRPNVPENQISISYAMKLMTKEAKRPLKTAFVDGSKGAKLFAQHCASCHGKNGQGGVSTQMISAAPYARLKTEPLLGHDGYWIKDQKAFNELVTKGLPGDLMPGVGTLSKDDVNELHKLFTDSLKKAQ